VGLKAGEATSILAEVRQNHALLRACTRHQFRTEEPALVNSLSRHHVCINCGGRMSGEKIAYYAEGVGHCGDPFEVWLT